MIVRMVMLQGTVATAAPRDDFVLNVGRIPQKIAGVLSH